MNKLKEYLRTLWNDLKYNTHDCYIPTGCARDCNQGRNCTCNSKIPDILQIDDMIGRLHYLSNSIEDKQSKIDIKILANELAKIGNRIHEKNSGTQSSS